MGLIRRLDVHVVVGFDPPSVAPHFPHAPHLVVDISDRDVRGSRGEDLRVTLPERLLAIQDHAITSVPGGSLTPTIARMGASRTSCANDGLASIAVMATSYRMLPF